MAQPKLYDPLVVVSDPITFASTGTTVAAIDVPAKTLVTEVTLIITTALAGGTPSIDVGDGDDADGWVDTTDITETTVGSYRGDPTNTGSYSDNGRYYLTADTIDVVLSASLSAGVCYVVARMIRLDEVLP